MALSRFPGTISHELVIDHVLENVFPSQLKSTLSVAILNLVASLVFPIVQNLHDKTSSVLSLSSWDRLTKKAISGKPLLS